MLNVQHMYQIAYYLHQIVSQFVTKDGVFRKNGSIFPQKDCNLIA